MEHHTHQHTRTHKTSVLTGVFGVCAVFIIGFFIAWGVGITSPTELRAQILPPCCALPPLPPPPIPPPPVIPPSSPSPVCTLSASPTSINQGGSATLTWTTQNATSASINRGVGAVTPVAGGGTSVSPTSTTVYTLTATGPGGTVTCTATVTVTTTQNAPVCTLSASPLSITPGGTSSLTWTTQNATTASINQGVGAVTPVSGGSTSVTPANTTTYTLTASNGSQTVTCTATVTVTTNPNAPICTLSASPTSINQGGSSTLTWSAQNVTTLVFNQGIGTTTPVLAGSIQVSPTSNTTYQATFSGPNGTVTCNAAVTVGGGNGGTPPSCLMSLDRTSIRSGESATLTWSGIQLASGVITQGIGTVGPAGSQSVSPSGVGSHTYLGTFTANNGQTVQCQATLTVSGGSGGCVTNCGGGTPTPTVTLDMLRTPTEAPLAFLYLSQIPYTGFPLGPVGTFFYWVLLIVWSAAFAYLILFRAIPFVGVRISRAGKTLSEMINTAQGETFHVVAQGAPLQKEIPETRDVFVPQVGFRSFAKDAPLTVEDIVKGLARTKTIDEEVFLTREDKAEIEAERHSEKEYADSILPEGEKEASGDIGEMDTPSFIGALIKGDAKTVFGHIRALVQKGEKPENFLTEVALSLDDVYRARLDGSSCDERVLRVCEDCDTDTLERLIGSLATAVDTSYTKTHTAIKLALTRALAVVG